MRAVENRTCLHAVVGQERGNTAPLGPFRKQHAKQPLRARNISVGYLTCDRAVSQQIPVPVGNCPLASDNIRQTLDLGETDGGADIGHPIVETKLGVPVTPFRILPLVLQEPQPRGQFGVPRGDHAAFAGRHGLIAEKAETGDVAERSGVPSGQRGANGFGAILDNQQALRRGDFLQRVHLAYRAIQMDRHDRLGAFGDLAGDLVRIDEPIGQAAVDEYRLRAGLDDGVDARNVAEGRDDHFVARPYSQTVQGQMKRNGPVRDGDSVRNADGPREFRLEPGVKGSVRRNPGRSPGIPGHSVARSRKDRVDRLE